MALEYGELTEVIIGAAIQVHRVIGPGFKESVYQNALALELRKRTLEVETEHLLILEYDGIEIGRHRLDMVVNGTIVVENKRVESFHDRHFAQLRSYLKAAGLKHGLLLNFDNAKLEVKRVIYDPTRNYGSLSSHS